jgi:hypothetical protein
MLAVFARFYKQNGYFCSCQAVYFKKRESIIFAAFVLLLLSVDKINENLCMQN